MKQNAEREKPFKNTELETPIIEDLEVNGVHLKIVGVEHQPKTLDENHDQFENFIEQSSAVILEGFPQVISVHDKLPWPNLRYLLPTIDQRTVDFYRSLAEICKKNNKDIIIVDPVIDLKNFLIATTQDTVSAGLFFAGLGVLGLESYQRTRGKKVSRRTVLKALGAIIAGSATFSPLPAVSTGLIDAAVPAKDFAVEKLNNFGYSRIQLNYMGFRDIAISEGIDHVTASKPNNQTHGPLVMFYGALHTGSLKHYLTDGKLEREVRERIYSPLAKLSSPRVTQYSFDGKEWQVVYQAGI